MMLSRFQPDERVKVAIDADLEREVQSRLLHLAFAALPTTLLQTIVGGPLFVGMLWPLFSDTQSLVFWCVAIAINIVGQASLWFVWQQRGPWRTGSFERWHRVLWMSSAGLGICWSVGPALLMGAAEPGPAALLVACLCLVSILATNAISAQPPAVLAFSVTSLLPPAVAAGMTGGDIKRLAALLLVAALVALTVIARRSAASLQTLQLAQTQLNTALAEASASRRQAEDASHAKSRFLANMSHELRSPLNAVIGAAQLLRTEQPRLDHQSHLVDAIQRGGNNLLGLIENVLDLSRIEAGEMPLYCADFHLVECIEAALSTGALAARNKGVRLICIIDPHLLHWRNGDSARLRQVVLNLLGNAVKFTDHGHVLVRVAAGSGEHGVHIEISDTGVGISAEALGQIFEPFRQGEESASRRYGGSGLGLAIAKQLVLAMGGTLEAESRQGSGSTFVIDLPLAPAEQMPTQQPPLALRVAFHEPDPLCAEAVRAYLQLLDCEAFAFDDAASLRKWLKKPADDVATWVLMAVDAPACQAMLEDLLDVLDLERLLLMADQGSGLADHARMGHGLARQVLRPLTRSALVSTFQPRVQATDVAVAVPPVPFELMSPTQLQALTHVLVVEDDELNRTIVTGLLEHAGFRVLVACDGAEAMDVIRSAGRLDVVFMDWQMPGMDGLEVTRELRRGHSGALGQQVPIVALTANAFAEDRQSCLDAGMDDFLTKPVQAEKLHAAVRRWAGRFHTSLGAVAMPTAPAQMASAVTVPAPPSTPPVVFDPSVLSRYLTLRDNGRTQFSQRLLTLYLTGTPKLLRRVQEAGVRGDAQALRRALHELKSSSGSVGALEMQALATEHDTALRKGLEPDPLLHAVLTAAWSRFSAATEAADPSRR